MTDKKEFTLHENLKINGYRYSAGFIELLFNDRIQHLISITLLGLEEVKEEKLLLFTPEDREGIRFDTIEEAMNYLDRIKERDKD
jgi:hypothetical protein